MALNPGLEPAGNTSLGAVTVTSGNITVNNGNLTNAVNIQDGGNSITVDGPLTDAQLRASVVPVSLASTTITGSVTVTGTVAATQSGTWNIGSITTLPVGHNIIDSGIITSITNAVAVTNAGLSNLDVALSTRLKPADTLAGVTTVGTVTAVTAITNALPAGTNVIGHVLVDSGNITVNNGNLTSAVNIQDGGNSITVDGIFWQTTQPVSDANLELAQGTSAAATVGPMMQAVVSDTPPSFVDGFVQPLSLTNEGRLRVSSTPALIDIDFFGEDWPTMTNSPEYTCAWGGI